MNRHEGTRSGSGPSVVSPGGGSVTRIDDVREVGDVLRDVGDAATTRIPERGDQERTPRKHWVVTDPVEGHWSTNGRPRYFESSDQPIAYELDGIVPKDILTEVKAVADEEGGAVSEETGLDNTPPSTFEGFDGRGWSDEYFDQVAAVSVRKTDAIDEWGMWGRWLATKVLGLEHIAPARSPSGRPFPPAILRKTCAGIEPHVDSASDEYPGTCLDLGTGGSQWSMISYLTNHRDAEGSLIVYDHRPLENSESTVSYPLDRPDDDVARLSIRPLVARTAIVRSDHLHEVLPTKKPRIFLTMFVVVAADGTAISAG